SLANDPSVLLCDEPLLSLDMHHQKVVAALLHEQRVKRDAAVVFVTHEINPILPYVDRILYIVGGHFLVGTPAEVMTTESLSRLRVRLRHPRAQPDPSPRRQNPLHRRRAFPRRPPRRGDDHRVPVPPLRFSGRGGPSRRPPRRRRRRGGVRRPSSPR